MDIVSRAKGIILRPRTEWTIIDAEQTPTGSLYAQFLIPLAIVGAAARFIGTSVIGVGIPFVGRFRLPLMTGLTSAIIGLVALLVGAYVWALIINALAPTFGGRKDLSSALKLAVYSATPVLVAGVLSVLPSLVFVQLIAALYSLYVLYLGFPVLMKVAPDRAVGYTAATVASGIVLGLIFGAVSTVLGVGRYGYGGSDIATQAAAQQAGQAIAANVLGAVAGNTAASKAAAAEMVAGAVAAGQAAAAQAGSARPATDSAIAASADPAAAIGAAAAVVGAMASGGKPAVEPVAFQTLKDALPATAGSIARTDASGEKTSAGGFSVSTAEGTYQGSGGANVMVKITDMGNASGMISLGKMAFAVESESDRGYEKNVTLNGQKVHEKWTSSGKSSELVSFIGDRFMVEVHGYGVDAGTAEKAFSSIDLGKLKAPK